MTWKRIPRVQVAIITFFVVAGSFLQGCRQDAPQTRQKRTPSVRLMRAEKADFTRSLDVTGTVVPVRSIILRSPAEGPLIRANVREGDRVRAGDTLAILGRREAVESLIASFREELRKEELNLQRVEQLVASGAIPGEQLDQARVSYERVKAQLTQAYESNQDYHIIAPWSGIISNLLAQEGNYLAPRDPIIEMFDPTSLVIRASIPEQHAVHLQLHQETSVQLDAYPGVRFAGTASRLYPRLDERSRTRVVEFRLTNPPTLLPGMFARVQTRTEQISDAIFVPGQAIVVAPDGTSFVFVYRDGKVHKNPVAVGVDEQQRVQILTGVEEGESIVVAGIASIRDGMDVQIQSAKVTQGSSNNSGSADTSSTRTVGQ